MDGLVVLVVLKSRDEISLKLVSVYGSLEIVRFGRGVLELTVNEGI